MGENSCRQTCLDKSLICGKKCFDISWFLIRDKKRGISLSELGLKSHFSWKVGAQWELKVTKKISCNKSKVLSKFSADLDFIHGIDVNKNSNIYSKETKEPQISKKWPKYDYYKILVQIGV